ncbi:UNVERIFIED_CONTAM: ABC transporter permease [Microbacterium sp. SLM126]
MRDRSRRITLTRSTGTAVGRLFQAATVVLGAISLVFFIGYFTGQSAARTVLGPIASPEQIARFEEENGLLDPLIVQYFRYIGRVVTGDLGQSLVYKQPVGQLIVNALPVTISLAVLGTALAAIISLVVGSWAAVKRDGAVDRGVRVFTSVGQSLPVFWLGIILIQIFAVNLRLVPAGGYTPLFEDPAGWARQMVLPVLALAIPFSCAMTRIVRASMLEELDKDYVRTARGLGLSQWTLMSRNVMRNGLVAPVTILGLNFGALLGGAVLVEAVFRLPGLGGLLVTAIMQRDFGVVAGATIVAALAFVVINLLVDVIQRKLNPRPTVVTQ